MNKEGRIRSDAETYWLLEAEALLELFKRATGRAARTIEELTEWAVNADLPKKGPINPYAVLSREHIEAFLVANGRD